MTKPQKGSGKSRHPATAILHNGRDPAAQHGFVNTPAYRGSTVLFPTLDALEAYDDQLFKYGRHGTPTTAALEEAISKLEGGQRTLLTASGYQAVTTAILAFVKAGDHVLMVDSVYQPTRKFCDSILARLGVGRLPLLRSGRALVGDRFVVGARHRGRSRVRVGLRTEEAVAVGLEVLGRDEDHHHRQQDAQHHPGPAGQAAVTA